MMWAVGWKGQEFRVELVRKTNVAGSTDLYKPWALIQAGSRLTLM